MTIMRLRHTIATASGAVLLLATLTACFGGPVPPVTDPGTDTGTDGGTELVGTQWSGVDSDGDSWGFEFQSDGTIGLTYNGNSYDDASDTWAVSGGQLDIHAAFDDGDMDLTGPYQSGATSVNLNGSYPGGTFTLTITQD